MGEVAKWALLVAGAVVIVGLILTLPFIDYIDGEVFGDAISVVVSVCSTAFRFGRGVINNLLSPWARSAVSGLMIYFIGKQFLTLSIKLFIWVYHFIFK